MRTILTYKKMKERELERELCNNFLVAHEELRLAREHDYINMGDVLNAYGYCVLCGGDNNNCLRNYVKEVGE